MAKRSKTIKSTNKNYTPGPYIILNKVLIDIKGIVFDNLIHKEYCYNIDIIKDTTDVIGIAKGLVPVTIFNKLLKKQEIVKLTKQQLLAYEVLFEAAELQSEPSDSARVSEADRYSENNED